MVGYSREREREIIRMVLLRVFSFYILFLFFIFLIGGVVN